MNLTTAHIKAIMPQATAKAIELYLPHMNALMPQFGIDTAARASAFLAQVAHESGQLRYARELWGPSKWQSKYEGNKDLGNIYPGDGFKFLGRGLIQITGRANYEAFGRDVRGDKNFFTTTPDLVQTPMYAVMSACWYWKSRNLNKYADAGDFSGLTKRINAAKLNYAERVNFWEAAKKTLQDNAGGIGLTAIILTFFF